MDKSHDDTRPGVVNVSGGCGATVLITITGDHGSKSDQILLPKLGKYIAFCVYRRSCLMWSTVIVLPGATRIISTAATTTKRCWGLSEGDEATTSLSRVGRSKRACTFR